MTKRHDHWEADVKRAANELGFTPYLFPDFGYFEHPNGNIVYSDLYYDEPDARRKVKALIDASGSRIPLSNNIESRPKCTWGLFRRGLDLEETIKAQDLLIDMMEDLEDRLDHAYQQQKLPKREVANLIGHWELVEKELIRLGIWIGKYQRKENK